MSDAFVKDPGGVLDFKRDWKYDTEAARAAGGTGNGWLASGETITTSTWTVPTGITKDSDSNADGLAVVWLSGGTVGQSYRVVNTVVTSAGRTDRRSITVSIQDR